MKILVALAISAIAASGIGLPTATPASAGCQGAWTPWGGGTRCDGPIAPDGTFERCDTAGAMGFGGTTCYLLNVNNLSSNGPWVGP